MGRRQRLLELLGSRNRSSEHLATSAKRLEPNRAVVVQNENSDSSYEFSDQNCGLWGEVFRYLAGSLEPPDLRAIAKELQQESKVASRAYSQRGNGTKASGEWQICQEILEIAQTRKMEIEKRDLKSSTRRFWLAYNEISTWVQKFVTIGDVLANINPVHVGIPWAAVRATLIVRKVLRSFVLPDFFQRQLKEIREAEGEINKYETLSIKSDYLEGKDREKINDWISKVDVYSHHRAISVLPGTGLWFLSRQEFRDWESSDESSLLWLRGNAGTGKTSLISCVVDRFLAKPNFDGKETLLYFYCSRTSGDLRQHDEKSILLSILRQLAAPVIGLPIKRPVVAIYEKERARGSQEACFSISDIVAVMDDLIRNHYDNVTLVLDALDECSAVERLHLLETLTKLTFNSMTVVKTLVSSRSDPEIEAHFSKSSTLSITASDNSGDIVKYVHEKLSERLLGGRASPAIQKHVEDTLIAKANGVFRWAALQVETLCDPDRVYSEKDVKYLLPMLPPTLEDTYAQVLEEIGSLPLPSREAITQVLQLLICAEGSMSVRQIVEGLYFLSSRQASWKPDVILKMGRGLIIRELERDLLVFSHLSVREYLEKKPQFRGENAHAVAAEACLKTYLIPNELSSDSSIDRFHAYACSYVGRHCQKSGSMRQMPPLKDLMRAFLCDDTTNEAFNKWRRDISKFYGPAELGEKPSTSNFSLFMICRYAFNEFIESKLVRGGSIFDARNWHGNTPLEVAAASSNFVAMDLLYKASLAQYPSSIRGGKWLESAAKSDDLDIWNYVCSRVSGTPIALGLHAAAQNTQHSFEMVKSLLEKFSPTDENTLTKALVVAASLETVDLILAHCPTSLMPHHLVEASVQNQLLNPQLTQKLLTHFPESSVTEDCFLLSDSSRRTEILEVLLKHPFRCVVSEEMVCEMTKTLYFGKDIMCLSLLLPLCRINSISEDLLVAAACQEVLQGAMKNHYHQHLGVLLSRADCPTVLEESFYIMANHRSLYNVVPALEACEDIYITDALMQACAKTMNVDDVKYIISQPRAFSLSERVLYSAVENDRGCGTEVFKYLVHKTSGFKPEPSENALIQAHSRPFTAYNMTKILADLWKRLPVTEKSMIAMVKQNRDFDDTFQLLRQYCECTEASLTDSILHAAIEANNVDFVEYFVREVPHFEVQEDHLRTSIASWGQTSNYSVLKRLLSLRRKFPISRSLIDAAITQRDQSILDLLLAQPDVLDPPLISSELLDVSSKRQEDEEETTFDTILSAASREIVGTRRVRALLSKYLGPPIDSNHLVEVAAERDDGKFLIQYVLSSFPETLITQRALLAAARNTNALPSLLSLLLEHYKEDVNSEIIQAAAGNQYHGTSLVELLLACAPSTLVMERAVFIAAMKNIYCGRSLYNLFRQRQPAFVISQDLVDAASENEVLGKVLLQMFLKHALASSLLGQTELVFNKLKDIPDGIRDSLFMAVCYNENQILNFLLSRDIPTSTVSGELGTALNVAVYTGNTYATKRLLEKGSDPESLSHLYGTPLQTACQKRDTGLARILVDYGVDVERQIEGLNSLHRASKSGALDIIEFLLSSGASTSTKDYQGMSALHHAAGYKVSNLCVRRLLEAGGAVNDEDSYQWTPLHWAAKCGAAETVKLLLEAGASRTKEDRSGRTPLQIAMFCGNIHLRALLFCIELINQNQQPTNELPTACCDGCDLTLRERMANGIERMGRMMLADQIE
ncbi:uncharacterized protein KY384_009217 [Bacidia gigantensis]|uniref:uncharacterized protein n=1 Tax=Bacidia gigantensis TaxID=2732470 RepID=UPI001D03C27B|nr:uncharacterized protein KY384_009217 [Bacidia gigantensis]KAG8525573.1 hypothetical protein KY384_009217 [Bacidia gigantensis]